MVSFKAAAKEILHEAEEPLHYEEITKRALEGNLIETSGKTPERTMHMTINQDKAFMKMDDGVFDLNPEYVEDAESEERDEEIEVARTRFDAATQFIGKAGEYMVVGELLFRGYNASIMSVDIGQDIVATKDNKLFDIQVKTSQENKFNRYVCDIRKSAFEKFDTKNMFYIFVLKRMNETNFLILPSSKIEENVSSKHILTINDDKSYRVNISIRDGKPYLGKQKNDVSFYYNNWELIK